MSGSCWGISHAHADDRQAISHGERRTRPVGFKYPPVCLLRPVAYKNSGYSLHGENMRCWLCEYNDDPVAKGIRKFISEQAGTMGPELMAERVHDVLVEKCPMYEGIGLEEVREHIMVHTLCPNVRVACILRSLLRIADKLESVSTSVDQETGQTVVDAKNVQVYLKVVSEVMQMYRTGEVSKLRFGQDNGKS